MEETTTVLQLGLYKRHVHFENRVKNLLRIGCSVIGIQHDGLFEYGGVVVEHNFHFPDLVFAQLRGKRLIYVIWARSFSYSVSLSKENVFQVTQKQWRCNLGTRSYLTPAAWKISEDWRLPREL